MINLKQFLGVNYQGDCPEHQALTSPDTPTKVVIWIIWGETYIACSSSEYSTDIERVVGNLVRSVAIISYLMQFSTCLQGQCLNFYSKAWGEEKM